MKISRAGMCEAFYDMPLYIQFVLTTMCNYNCSYCFGHNKLSRGGDFPTLKQLQTAINHIAECNRSYYRFNVSGGEATYHPNFFEFTEYAYDVLGNKLGNFHLTSNGSRNLEIYLKLAEIAEQRNSNVDMMVSLHTEFVSMKHIVELVKAVSSKINLHFVIMFNLDKKELVKEIYATMFNLRKYYPFKMRIMLLLVPPAFRQYDPRYTAEDILWQWGANEKFKVLDKQSSLEAKFDYLPIGKPFLFGEHNGKPMTITNYDPVDFFQLGLLDFRGLWCLHGSHTLNIFPNGNCEGLVCAVCYNQPNRFKYNIFRENPYKSNDFVYAIKCPFKECMCDFNWWTPKFESKEELLEFMKIYRRKQYRLFKSYS